MPSLKSLLRLALAPLLVASALRAAPTKFDLPAQPAALALTAFARQTGLEVLFPFDELRAVQSTPVTGTHEPAEALALLLRGTGYRAARNAAGKFLVVRETSAGAYGQLRGLLLSAADGAPIAGAIVQAPTARAGARSRGDGSFLLRDLPAGEHTLAVQAPGFAAARIEGVAVQADRRTDLGPVRLAPASDGPERLAEVVVSAAEIGASLQAAQVSLPRLVVTPSRFGLDETRGAPAATLTESDLLALPQLGDDLYRAIAHLPGLAADDLTARFWVRGAPHHHVLARLDGVDLVEPFHLKDTDGSLGILDLEIISRLDLHTGGFGAEFGDRLAGVLAMETDRHVRSQSRTTVGVSFTGARLSQRGQSAGGRHRWLASARSGYPDIAIEQSETDGSTLRPRYHDALAKWEWSPAPEHTLSFHALHAGDRMLFREADGPVLTSRYDSDYGWARWRADLGPVQGETVLAFSRLGWRRDGTGRIDNRFPLALHDGRELRTRALRSEWSAELGGRALLRGGLEARAGAADYDFSSQRDRNVLRNGAIVVENVRRAAKLDPDGSATGAFVSARLRLGDAFALEPGLRHDRNTHARDRETSPRLAAAWTAGRTTLRAAWGRYAQAQGLHELSVQDGETSFRRAERAEHRVLSVEHRLPAGVSVRAEAYERSIREPQPRWENVIDATDALPELNGDRLRLAPLRSRARGLEFVAERRGGVWAWSANYALARAEETFPGGATVPRARDQRHTANLDLTWTPGPRWQFSAAWRWHTGWPVTESIYSLAPLAGGGRTIISSLGALYGLRLPDYHRLDLRAQRRFVIGRTVLRAYVDIFNVLDRRNRLTYDYTVNVVAPNRLEVIRRDGEKLFPRLPSVGFNWDF